jgi:hypothetical protein
MAARYRSEASEHLQTVHRPVVSFRDWLAEVQFRGGVVEHHNLIKLVSTRYRSLRVHAKQDAGCHHLWDVNAQLHADIWLGMQCTKQIKLNMALHATVQGAK